MCRSIIVNAGSKPQLEDLLQHVAIPLVIICPDRAEMTEPAAKFLAHRFIGANALADAEQWRPVEVAVDSIVHLLFTWREHRGIKRCNGVPRQRATLRGLRREMLRLHEQRSPIANIRSYI